MIIKQIHITSFGPLVNFDAELYPGFNLIVGENESGKTSLAMFIKFIFYGLSGRSIDGRISERKKYVNFDRGAAEGFLVVRTDKGDLRIERSIYVTSKAGGRESARESISVTDALTGERRPEIERCPGEELFGVPEQVFVNTVFCGQSNGVRIDGATTAAAVENLMFSADETVSVKKAAELLEKYRRSLQHKNGGGGEIAAMRERESQLRTALEESSRAASEIIELEGKLTKCKDAEAALASDIAKSEKILEMIDARTVVRSGEEAERADKAEAAAERSLREALAGCADPHDIDDGGALISQIDAEWRRVDNLEDRLRELEFGAAKLERNTNHEDPERSLEKYRTKMHSRAKFTALGTVFAAVAALGGAAAGILYYMKDQLFLAGLGAAAAALILCGIFFALRSKSTRTVNAILDEFDVMTEDELALAVDDVLADTDKAREMRRAADSTAALLDQSRTQAQSLEDNARALARKIGGTDGTDATAALTAAIAGAREKQGAADAARRNFEAAHARSAALWENIPKENLAKAREFLASAPENGTISDNAAAQIKNETMFNRAKLEALTKKQRTLELELAARRAATVMPSVIHDELEACERKLEALELRHNAAVLAESTLAEAGENMRRGILPKIIGKASELFCRATENHYESLGGGADFSISTTSGGRTHSGDHLSSGTEDLAYLCLRLALAEVVLGKSRPPLVFDEGLAFMDPERTDAAIEILEGSGYQVFLLSCRDIDGTSPTVRMTKPSAK